METMWIQAGCPSCGRKNWICDGDYQDCTYPDTQAIRCFACNTCWWRDPEFEEFDASDVATTGMSAPYGLKVAD